MAADAEELGCVPSEDVVARCETGVAREDGEAVAADAQSGAAVVSVWVEGVLCWLAGGGLRCLLEGEGGLFAVEDVSGHGGLSVVAD